METLDRTLVLAVLAGVAGLALVVGVYVFASRRRLTRESALRDRLRGVAAADATAQAAIFREERVTDSVLDRLFQGRSAKDVVETATRRAGLRWTVGEFAGYVLLGLSIGILAALLLPPLQAVLVGVLGALAPFLVVARARRLRDRQIEEQLPDAVDMLVNALRAGYSLQAGMNFVGSEMPAPVGTEFERFYDEQRLGMDVRQALENLQERLGTLDARMMVLAIIIQRETGGNLAEVLGNIGGIIRERINFRAQVGVLTAESKLSAIVLTALPPMLFVIIRFLNPTYIAQLTETSSGQFLMLYALVSLVIGFVILRRMAEIEV